MKNPYVKKNKEAILDILKNYIKKKGSLLEIGSGNGEHAIYFAEYFKYLQWTTSDIKTSLKYTKKSINGAKLPNIKGPIKLKVGTDDFPKGAFDFIFSADTLHIMSWKENKSLFKLLGKRLREGAIVFFYGPFKNDGNFTSESSIEFDQWIKKKNSKSGIRNFEDVVLGMEKVGLKLLKNYEMPEDNRILVFERLPFNKEME